MQSSVTVQVLLGGQSGGHLLQGREVEFLEVTQAVGDHARCTLRFDRNANSTSAPVRAADLADATLRVRFEQRDGGAWQGFSGYVRTVDVEHGPNGTERFTVTAVSPSYVLGEHADRRYWSHATVEDVARAFGVRVVGTLPPSTERDYVQPGTTAWAFLARLAAHAGLQLRAVWPRLPGGTSPAGPAEIGRGFDPEVHELAWGVNLLRITTSLRPTNPGVAGAFYDVAKKHDRRFRGVRSNPQMLGGAAPLVAAAQRVAQKDAGGGDPGYVLTGARAEALADYRERLERVSARRLGRAVVVAGESTRASLRAGDRVDVRSVAGSLQNWASGRDDEWTGEFGLISVVHRWDGVQYHNTFEATPWADYHPAPAEAAVPPAAPTTDAAPAATTAAAPVGTWPVEDDVHGAARAGLTAHGAMLGLTIGFVVDNNDPERQGRVRVRYTWMGEQDPVDRTKWLRVAAPVAGHQRGLGALPSLHDEVLLAPLDGDPERMVVVGALWNGVDKAAHAPGRQSWITPAGNTLVFRENQPGDGQETVELYSREGKAWVQLASKGPGGVPLVTVHSEGDLSLEAPNGTLWLSARQMHTQVQGDVGRQVTGHVLDRVSGDWALEAKGALQVSSDSAVRILSDGTIMSRASGTHTLVGQEIFENPPVAPIVPPSTASLPSLPSSAWQQVKPPTPAQGKSTEDPTTPLTQPGARAAAATSSQAVGGATAAMSRPASPAASSGRAAPHAPARSLTAPPTPAASTPAAAARPAPAPAAPAPATPAAPAAPSPNGTAAGASGMANGAADAALSPPIPGARPPGSGKLSRLTSDAASSSRAPTDTTDSHAADAPTDAPPSRAQIFAMTSRKRPRDEDERLPNEPDELAKLYFDGRPRGQGWGVRRPRIPPTPEYEKNPVEYARHRAEELNAPLDPREEQGVTFAVTVYRERGGNGPFKVLITSSTNHQDNLPKKVSPLKPGEMFVNPDRDTGSKYTVAKPQIGPDGKIKTDADGNELTTKSTKFGHPDAAQRENDPKYHHAERRALRYAQRENLKIVAIEPTRKCCGSCKAVLVDALGQDGFNDVVRPPRRG